MEQDFFHLIWVSTFILGCMVLPIVLGLISVLTDRD